jgi:hypothetical protein
MDDQLPFRWSSEFIRTAIEDAVAFLHAARPETRYVNGVLTDGVELPNNALVDFPIHSRFREGIVAYMAYKCLESENPDTQNLTLADSYLNKAKSLMQI